MQKNRPEKDRLILPSCRGLLDCFNTGTSKYSNGPSLCHLITREGQQVNTTFIAGLYSYIYHHFDIYGCKDYEVKTEQLRQFLGYSRGGKSHDIKNELCQLNNVSFWWQGETNLLAEVEVVGRTTTITSRYFQSIALAMRAMTEVEFEVADGTAIKKHTASYVSLVYAEIISNSNHSAVEIVFEICKLVERRGTFYGAPAHLSIYKLIQRCQALRNKLDVAKSVSRKNQILRDDLSRALVLLKEYTSLYEDYRELTVEVPGKLSVTEYSEIIIRHKGKKETIKLRKERKNYDKSK